MRRTRAAYTAAVIVVAALAVGGCGADERTDSASSPAGEPLAGAAAAPGGAAPEAARDENTGAVAPVDLRVDQRAIVYTGAITVRLPDGESVDGAAARATSFATGAGGFVGSDKRSSGDGQSQATLELRVPAARFTAVVDQLAGLGEAQDRTVDTKDVTEETVDLDARIRTQQARVDSGRRLLAQADDLSDLVMLEGELAKRESDLAALEARKRRLADLTALSTITAVLLDPQAPPPGAGDSGGFLGGLTAGWHALTASLKVLLTVLGALLPWVLVLAVPAVGVLLAVRRARRRPAQPVPAAVSSTAPPSA